MAVQRLRTILRGRRKIVIGFAVGSATILMILVTWPHSGVAGTLTRQDCQASTRIDDHRCSIKPAEASVTVAAFGETWTTRSDAAGHFRLDLPPGGYSLTAEIKSAVAWNRGQTSFPVFVNRTTQLQLLLLPWFPEIKGGICLSAEDRISTPTGPIAVSQVRAGMIVWTLGAAGARIAAPVLRVSHLVTPPGYRMLRITLSDGRVVDASAGHPTVNSQRIGELKAGDLLDGSRLRSVEQRGYAGDTWDLLPAGPSGDYWANDVLLGSTLGPGVSN
jgi:hypothetical protein